MTDHVWFYLDESGPFEDRKRGDYWPVSVVAGLVSRHELTNKDMRPVLDDICRHGNHNLQDRDLHARELRDRLGKHYDDWMIHALRSTAKLGDDVEAVVFRSTERLNLGDTDTNYLNVAIEGLVRVIPQLQEDAKGPLRITVVLENRRVTGIGTERGRARPSEHDGNVTAAWEREYVGRRDRSVPRASYVALEDYATRLRTRLLVELTRRGLTSQLRLLRDISIKVSDPATDKALNYADFIAHHGRYSDRGADARVWSEGMGGRVAWDIHLVIHSGFEAASRKVEERHYGSALFDLIEVIQETDSDTVRSSSVQLVTRILDELADAPASLVARHIDEYFEAVEDLDLLRPDAAETDGADDPTAYLQALDVWARNSLSRVGVDIKTEMFVRDTIVLQRKGQSMPDGPDPRTSSWAFAWQWGLFRCHNELLALANLEGDVAGGEKATVIAEPLLGPFARSVEHQPQVFEYLRRLCRHEILAGRSDAAIGRLDSLIAFHNDTEDWWAVDLPRVLPSVGDNLDRGSIMCRPLGLALHLRALARLAGGWGSHATLPGDEMLKAACDDMVSALEEFTFPSDRYDVKTTLALVEALAGNPDRALRWIASSLAGRTDDLMAEAERGENRVLDVLVDGISTMHDPAAGGIALIELLRRLADPPDPKESPVCAAWRREALGAKRVVAAVNGLGELPVRGKLRLITLFRARGRCLCAWDEAGAGMDLTNRAAGMSRGHDARSTPLDHLHLGCTLDIAAQAKKKAGDHIKTAKDLVMKLRKAVPGNAALHQLFDDLDALGKNPDGDELRALADRVWVW